ncbi:6,7-dimethyl-8-ribityllumazine synthase [Francisella philomiragia]|uniref:6,7-dimethyl-8-ribityllumazine synthase n=1 Tax=Francisella philomiragia TaxID=28110 RepID=A0AAW3D9X0_9GAMM|nr:6,7-dimethyl-8-ribityllumazine synthase [Francisella philomiragia]KFJ42047.1 6,7-dimethyl-8-ribityllumazine synthase [Francisella philomiragia]MBK2253940.1 6,7-dimethyl-8-ribityllumazine synthase [Francisella philomiragia]MBK2272252.1 6,7-dimethyl-8-ribityllumazine synthase [Francisella philomiragia]MBK2276094.1 6,7-dimethyl-8-ribityllumazine synthase [Francisella philomiragia]MBK2278459.1 6,7-dimethyl-8-ribityllumazine synthase [Francisella philomiragia]
MRKLAIVVSEFNSLITDKMLEGALEEAYAQGLEDSQIYIKKVPGAVELPYAAKLLAETNEVDAVVLLGCVIRGETDHYDYVCDQVSYGTQRVMHEYNLPVIFGILTTHNKEQALERVGGKKGHKGKYCVQAALTMAKMKKDILEQGV